MNESADHGGSASSATHSGPETGAPSPGVTVSAARDVGISNSNIVGRDYTSTTAVTNDNRTRNIRVGVGLGSLAIVLLYFGIHAAVSSATDVVYKAGVQGATGTVQQLQQAEAKGDASTWCFLASSNDSSTCQALISNGYTTTASEQIRNQIPQISIGQPSGNGDTYTYDLIYQGHSYPVQMVWTGQRWQLNELDYLGGLNDDGLFSAVIEVAHGQGAAGGVPFG